MPKQTLKRRADGRYQKRITLSNGKTRLVYGRTEAELKAAVRSVQAQDEAGLEVGDHTLVGEWAKIWLRSYKQGLRPATTKMYRDAYNLHIMQHIGCMELQEVRPVHIRAIMAEITEQSESLQHKVLITVRQIMQTAQANHLIRDDPTDGIRITTHARPKQKKYLTQDEAEELLSSIAEPRAKVLLRALLLLRPAQGRGPGPAMAGCRPGGAGCQPGGNLCGRQSAGPQYGTAKTRLPTAWCRCPPSCGRF